MDWRPVKFIFVLWISMPIMIPVNAKASPVNSHWEREGLCIVRNIPSKIETPLIDVKRANEQQERGCIPDQDVRFGYSALMRQTAPPLQWSLGQRQALASAAFLDDIDGALRKIKSVLVDETLDPNQRAAIENQLLLTCLMFKDNARFTRTLTKVVSDDQAAPTIRADRLFLRAYDLSQRAHSKEDWQRIEELLVDAQRLDPSFFSIRVQRVANWLLAHRSYPKSDNCAKDVRELTDLVLDLSDAAPCSQLVGNVEHYLSRVLQDETLNRVGQPVISPHAHGGQWRLLETAMLAHVTRQEHVKKAVMQALEESSSANTCAEVIQSAIEELN